jgi:hypothetical protein
MTRIAGDAARVVRRAPKACSCAAVQGRGSLRSSGLPPRPRRGARAVSASGRPRRNHIEAAASRQSNTRNGGRPIRASARCHVLPVRSHVGRAANAVDRRTLDDPLDLATLMRPEPEMNGGRTKELGRSEARKVAFGTHSDRNASAVDGGAACFALALSSLCFGER